ELTEQAGRAIANREYADDRTGTLERAGAQEQRQHDQQHQTLECRLIELARMARQSAGAPENNPPWDVGHPTPQLGIDEVGKPPEEQPDWCDGAGDIAKREPRNPAPPGEQQDGGDTAEKAAMERHAALPELYDLGWMLDEIRCVVEQHIADAATQDDA